MRKEIRKFLSYLLCISMLTGVYMPYDVPLFMVAYANTQKGKASESNAEKEKYKQESEEYKKTNNIYSTNSNASQKIEEFLEDNEEIEEQEETKNDIYDYRYKTDNGIIILIKASDFSWPKDTTIKVEEIKGVENDKIAGLVEGAIEEHGKSIKNTYSYDISFWNHGEEFEPEGKVKVTFQFPEDEQKKYQGRTEIFHIEDNANAADIMSKITDTEEEVSCLADGFSVYGIAVVENEYIPVYTADDLYNINNDLTADYVLMNDIDLANWGNWEPIGGRYGANIFSGSLDGNGYTINNLYIDISENSEEWICVGLFGEVASDVSQSKLIKNIVISNATVQVNASDAYVGVVAGINRNTDKIIDDCTVIDSSINVKIKEHAYIGGIVGHGFELKKCQSYTDIFADGKMIYVGGIGGVGSNVNCSQNCGNITVTSNSEVYSGGIIGTIGNIEKSFNSGNISVNVTDIGEREWEEDFLSISSTAYVGGIIGSDGVVKNCYNSGNISAEVLAENTGKFAEAYAALHLGGIFGGEYNDEKTEIILCYNIGEIKGFVEALSPLNGRINKTENIGGILGYLSRRLSLGDKNMPQYCYYVNTKEKGIGEDIDVSDECIALSISEMKNQKNFKEFDFNSIWKMGKDNYEYPIFQWQEGGTDPDVPEFPEENLVSGWATLENGNIGYYKYENNQCVLLKNGIYRLQYLDDNQTLYEGNWKFDSEGNVITGNQNGHYYYEFKDGFYPYGMEIKEDIRNILKTNPTASNVLGGYDFFDTFVNDLSLWDYLLASHPSDGLTELVDLGIGWVKWGIDMCINPFETLMKGDIPPSVMENYQKDVSLNKKVLEKILEEKFAQIPTIGLQDYLVYKATKEGSDKITGKLAEKFEENLKEKREQFEKNPNGNWSDSYKEFMDSMNESNQKSYSFFVSNQVAKSAFTAMETDEKWQEVFMDYSEKIDFLESIKNASNNKVLYDAANDLQSNYQNKFMNTLADTIYTTFEQGNDWRSVITGQEANPIPSVDFNENIETNIRNNVSSILIKKVPGLKESIATVEFLQNLSGSAAAIDTIVETQTMYDASLDLLRDTSNTLLKDGASSEELVEYQNAFELVKYMTIMRYEGMKKFYEVDENNDSDKKVKEDFLEKEIEKLKAMNVYNYFSKKSSVFLGEWNDLEKRYAFYRDTENIEQPAVIYYVDCWKWINGEKYYFDKDGHPYEGKQTVWDQKENKNYTYYFSTGTGDCDANKDHYGAMQTGEVKLGDKEYYFYPKTGKGARDVFVYVSPNEVKYYDINGIYDPFKTYKNVLLQEPGTKKYLINCPVDVYVYDSSNNLVASIINNEIQNFSNQMISLEIDKNEQKTICVPFDNDYVIEIIATGDGSMDYSIIEYPNALNENIRKIDYRDILLSKGDMYRGISQKITNGDLPDERLYLLLKDGEQQPITEVQENVDVYTINIAVDGAGSCISDDYAIRGNYIKLVAIPESGNRFSGWYTKEGICVSKESEYRFRVLESCYLTAKFELENGSSSGSSSGGSSGSGSLHRGSSSAAGKSGNTTALPEYVLKGTWVQCEDFTWEFINASGKKLVNVWAAVENPYANLAAGQQAFDWFRFDEKGKMLTGWYYDATDGFWYYLNPISDNTMGRMVTGWTLIDGCYYYFNVNSDGHKGRMYRNEITQDGYYVDTNGIWVVDRKTQVQ